MNRNARRIMKPNRRPLMIRDDSPAAVMFDMTIIGALAKALADEIESRENQRRWLPAAPDYAGSNEIPAIFQ